MAIKCRYFIIRENHCLTYYVNQRTIYALNSDNPRDVGVNKD